MKIGDVWVGDVPDGWAKERLKNSVASIQAGIWGDEPRGDETDIRCVRVADFDRSGLAVADENATLRSIPLRDQERFRLAKGDLLLEKSGGTASNPVGFVALYNSDAPAVCSNFIGRIRLRAGQSPRFWMYAHAASYYYRITQRSLNQTTGIQNLDIGAYLNEAFPFPPQGVQRAIADFLDRETAQIDAMIEAQGGLVDRLEERRRALTTEIVDSAVPDTKLGRLLKHHIRGVRQGWSPQCHPYPRSDDTEWAVLRTGCVNGGRFNPEDNKVLPEDLTPRQAAVVRRGEIVMSRANTRELLGSAAVVPEERPRLMLSDKLYALDTLPHANPWFIAGVLGTRRLRDLIEIAATGASQSMQNISQLDIVNLPMELPARDIQDEAVTRLAIARHQIDGLASAAVDAITLMQERRSALISAAVTGRINPRTGKETTPEKVLELE